MAVPLQRLQFGNGVANRMSAEKTPRGYARTAENVDISSDASISVRAGAIFSKSLAGAHSLWSHESLLFGLVADATHLYRLDGDASLTLLVSGLSGAPVYYSLTPLGVYWADDAHAGCIGFDGEPRTWGLPVPQIPAATATVYGGLDGGRYGVSASFVDASGQESGASASAFVDVVGGGGIDVVVAASADASVVAARIYVTTANGNELQFAGAVEPGATYNVAATPRGRRLDTQFATPLPPLRFPLLKAGRLYGAAGRFVRWSEPLRYDLTFTTRNFFALRDDVCMLAAPETDRFIIFVGTESRTYMFQGDALESAALSVVSPVGVIPGSMAMVDASSMGFEQIFGWVPMWVDKRGVPYVGSTFGPVVVEDKFAYPIYDNAAAFFDARAGDMRYIVAGRGGRPSPLQFSDSVVATVVDKTAS